MKKIRFIEQIQEGERVDDVFIVKSSRLAETRAGKPYLILEVADKTGEITGPVWEDAEKFAEICQVGHFIHIKALVQSYREKLQLRFEEIKSVPREQVTISDFVPSTEYDIDKMAEEIQRIIASLENTWVKKLLNRFLKKGELWQEFQVAPAAKGIHHAYAGGLMEHCLSMAKVAERLSDHYEGLDKSLLIAGVFLHDIGKIKELKEEVGLVDYTVAGRLKGHLVIGSEMVAEEAAQINDFPEDLLVQIQHLILSHHGRLEFGSPTVPMTPEAFLLNFIDELDSKMNLIQQLRRKQKGSEPQWSDYQRSLERFLFLAPIEKASENSIPSEQMHVQKKLF